MEFEKAVPERVRELLIPNVRRWISYSNAVPGSLSDLVSRLKDVVQLSEGDVGFVAADHVRAAAKQAIDAGETHYLNLRPLRVAIAEKLKRDNGIVADPDSELIVSSGCHAIIAQVFAAFVGPGDEVVMGTPDTYYQANTVAWGGTPVFVPLREEHRFHLDPNEVKAAITSRTKIIAITTPDGPTGAVHRREDLEAISELAIKHDLLVVSDEIYEKINFGIIPHFSIGSLPGMHERTITINGLSKGYAMTGWRVGYGMVPSHLMLAVRATNALNTIRLDSIAQHAALAALCGPQDSVYKNVAEYKRKMNILVDGINAIDGLHCQFPDGTYYCWVNIADLGLDPESFAKHCLLSERVYVSPGTGSFGSGGKHYVRTSCSAPEETIQEGLRRLRRAVERLREEGPLLQLTA
ncbi:MAG: aminotransferase class I/II-fold pyridoxal phosphate-dependent enzyme [Acidobacteria bacterium]|nr:aminotransferase class I/II-fold pyridoxal phosphate-dependent enzyme [Acidobacteriota bacterium]